MSLRATSKPIIAQDGFTYYEEMVPLTTVETVFLEAATGGRTIIEQIMLCNYSAADHTVTARMNPTSSIGGNAYLMFSSVAVNANETTIISGPISMSDGKSLSIAADANSVLNAYICYKVEN
jgi:hypothetical protein